MDEKLLLEAIGKMMDEKLATVIEPVRTDIADLMQGQIDLKQGQATANAQLDTMKDSMNVLKKDMSHHNHYVEPLLKAVKDGVDGLQERYYQIDAIEKRVDNHDNRIWALEQT